MRSHYYIINNMSILFKENIAVLSKIFTLLLFFFLFIPIPLAHATTTVDQTHYRFRNDPTVPATFSFTNPATSQLLGHTEPEVIKVGNTYYLYYRTDADAIAVASSPDGTNWTEQGTVLSQTARGTNLVANSSVET